MTCITIDSQKIETIAHRLFEDLLELELQTQELEEYFPYKAETPRYEVVLDNIKLGYFKVLSKKELANGKTSILHRHKQ